MATTQPIFGGGMASGGPSNTPSLQGYPGMGSGGSVGGMPVSPLPSANGGAPAYQPGDFSKLAFQMAGSPQFGPFPGMTPPPAPVNAAGSSNGGSNLSSLLPLLAGAALFGGGNNKGSSSNSGISNLVGKGYNYVKNLFGGSGDSVVNGIDTGIQSGAFSGASDALAGNAALGATTDASGVPYFLSGSLGGDAASTAGDSLLSSGSGSLLDSLGGFSSAGGGAAAPVADAAAAGGSDAAASGAATGSLGLGLLGVAATVAPALYGASQPGSALGSTWYNNFGNTIGAGLGPNATTQQKLLAASQLNQLGLMQSNGTGGGTGFSTASNFNMERLMQTLAPYGITNLQQANALANQLYGSIQNMPTMNSHPLVHTA